MFMNFELNSRAFFRFPFRTKRSCRSCRVVYIHALSQKHCPRLTNIVHMEEMFDPAFLKTCPCFSKYRNCTIQPSDATSTFYFSIKTVNLPSEIAHKRSNIRFRYKANILSSSFFPFLCSLMKVVHRWDDSLSMSVITILSCGIIFCFLRRFRDRNRQQAINLMPTLAEIVQESWNKFSSSVCTRYATVVFVFRVVAV